QLRGSLDIPASHVAVAGKVAYLAAGEAGLVIVDISNLDRPRVLSRVNNIGYVYDVSLQGNLAYLALGQKGVLTLDVTDPAKPVSRGGFETMAGAFIQVVEATAYSAIGGGYNGVGSSILQESPDLVLKLHSVDPANAILDRDGDGQLKVRLRFNKAIDQYAGNAQYFYVTGPNGQLLPTRTDIVNNDAIIYLEEPVKLVSGDAMRVVVEAGLAATKAVEQSGGPAHLTLDKLRSEQRIDLTYRGSRPYSIAIDSVVPRRIPAEQAHPITLSMLGVPLAPERVKLFVGGQALAIGSLKRSEQDSSIAIIEAQVPALQAAGLYDLTARVEFDGVWEEASLYGALQVDAPVRFTRIEPQWG